MPAVYRIKESKMLQKKYIYIYLQLSSPHHDTLEYNTQSYSYIWIMCFAVKNLPTSTRRKMITCIVTMSAIILEHPSILHSWRESCESIFSRRVASEVEEASGAAKQLTQKKSV